MGSRIERLPDSERATVHVRKKRSIDLAFTAGGIRRRVLECWPAV
jgi:hypothetical protein